MAACVKALLPHLMDQVTGNHPVPLFLSGADVRLDDQVFSLAARMVPGPAGIGLRLPGVSSIRAKALMSRPSLPSRTFRSLARTSCIARSVSAAK